ncbi:hypothetical protein JCM11251_006371 [Rhodosporidiobolus azoricus]
MVWPFTSSTPQQHTEAPPPSACPVDHSTRSAWLEQNKASSASPQHHSYPVNEASARADPLAQRLSTEREVSSIPRWLPSSSSSASSSSAPHPPSDHSDVPPPACPMHASNVDSSSPSGPGPSSTPTHIPSNPVEAAATIPSESNWVYPSPASFYTALERKNRNPNARDMDIVVPIHNAVNERVWAQVLDWEREALGIKQGEEVPSKLVSFVGKPKEVSPRARWKSLIGYTTPFDRHDWLVDRPVFTSSSSDPSSLPSTSSSPSTPPDSPSSIRIRYVIDFYTGRGAGLLAPPGDSGPGGKGVEDNFRPNLAFFIDCRPALDGWEGVRMRFNRYWGLGGGEEAKKV